ncbi:hypothetical protein SUGI_1185490 [Cryptomeria japonica]|nr:hypothetical protein SUGI_1185490 [Cryptomeria japonica]
MDPFSSPSPNSSSSVSNEHLMDQLKTQIAQAYAEEFLETLRTKCFAKCVTKPGTSLSGSESSCISRQKLLAFGCSNISQVVWRLENSANMQKQLFAGSHVKLPRTTLGMTFVAYFVAIH